MLTVLFSLIVLDFFGPLSAFQDEGSFLCQLTDAPSQCGAFCLSALQPIIDDNDKGQIKLNRIEEEVGSLKKTISREESALQVLQAKMENLETSIRELRNKTENQLLALENQQSDFQKNLLEILSTMNNKIIPPKFELIGARYFYIEHNIEKTWDEAASTCRGMGGYLASFKTEEELAAIVPKLNTGNSWYWTGLNKFKKDGQFISTASGKPAKVLKWKRGEPKNRGACVLLVNGEMFDYSCRGKGFFICQADNET